uniref:Uncharacterized protein n=1 Tax=Knipowitschia caucasica TaxID=637954 RepID=A0AAV2KCX4_KNICA
MDLILTLLSLSLVCPGLGESSYSVVSSSVIDPDVLYPVLVVNLRVQTVDFNLKIFLDQDPDQVLSSASALVQGDDEEVLHLPTFNSSSLDGDSILWLSVQGRVPSSDQVLVYNQTRLKLKPQSQTTLIQTDCSHYRPGGKVKIRVLSLRPDLTGLEATKNLIIKDPGGHIIRQWDSINGSLGISSLVFQLSQSPPLGKWTITATVQGVSTEKHFSVEIVNLPKFKVEISVPKRIYYKDNLHFHGKSVVGTLRLSFTHRSHGREKTFEKTSWFDGHHKFHYDVDQTDINKRMVFTHDYEEESIKIQATVTESMTGLQYNSSMRVDLVKHLYELSFVGHRNTIRPGSTFSTLLKVVRFDGAPPHESDLTVEVTVLQQRSRPWTGIQDRNPDHHPGQDPDHLSDQDSKEDWDQESPVSQNLELPVPHDGIIPLSIELRDDTHSLIIDMSLQDSYSTLMIHSSYTSPTGSYIQIHPPHSPPQAGSSVTLNIWSSFHLRKYNYVVMSQGCVVSAGSTSGDLVLDLNSAWTRSVFVLVFIVLPDGEIVTDRVQLNVQHQLRNHVSLRWSANTLKPHEGATLTATVSEPHSLVAISVVDMATIRDSAHNDITEHQLLMSFHKDQTLKKQQMDPHTLFTECGLLVLTDASFSPEPIPITHFLRGHPDFVLLAEADQINPDQGQVHMRTEFPETWIWTDLHTGDQTSAEVSAQTPDTITSWVASAFVMSPTLGIGFVDIPIKLTVFQDFFISLNLPAFAVRGEELLLEIHLYNYKHQDLTVEVVVSGDLLILGGGGTHTVKVKHGGAALVQVPVMFSSTSDQRVLVSASSPGAQDTVERRIYVKHEGVPRSYSESRLLLLSQLQKEVKEAILYEVPEHAVIDSCNIEVSAVGELLAFSLDSLDSLVQMPSGCGEQNMIHFAPMVYVLQYLKSIGETSGERVQKIKHLLTTGYEKQLSFLRRDGAFSAFGDSDPSGSTWLSAFVLRVFVAAQPFFPVGPEVVQTVGAWLMQQQRRDGHFAEAGRVIHSEMTLNCR